MAKKRVKRSVRKKISIQAKKVAPAMRGGNASYSRASNKKIMKVIFNLILFLILGGISYLLYGVSSQEIYVNLFYLLSFLFGFVSLAFFIALLVLIILKGMGR